MTCLWWCVALIDVGEYVKADEILMRVETDKVVVDILSQHDGVITKYFAEEGDIVEVGGQLLEIDTEAKAPAADATPAPPKQEAPAAAAPVSYAFNACLKYVFHQANILLTTFILNNSSQPLLPRQRRLPNPPQPRHPPLRPPQPQASRRPAPRRPRRRRQRSRGRAWRLASK